MNSKFLLALTVINFSLSSVHASQGSPGVRHLPDDPTEEIVSAPSDAVTKATEEIRALAFRKPNFTIAEQARVRAIYSYVDPLNLVPIKLRDDALAYFHANQIHFSNKNFVSIVDFSAHSSLARLFIIDMNTGAVLALHVAHGRGSDTNNDGYAEQFSNISGSKMSSLGYYATAETYQGSHGLSLRIDGLSSTNSNVRARAIVIHGSDYVSDADVTAGRSWGCFAIPMNDRDRVVGLLKGGSLLYAALSK